MLPEGKRIDFDEASNLVIGCALEVHRNLGPGLLESAYERCLCYELTAKSLEFQCQIEMPVNYKGEELNCGYRLDLFLPGKLVVELKAVEELSPIHEAQILTYMKLTKVPVGLLINFNVKLLKDGIRRFVI